MGRGATGRDDTGRYIKLQTLRAFLLQCAQSTVHTSFPPSHPGHLTNSIKPG